MLANDFFNLRSQFYSIAALLFSTVMCSSQPRETVGNSMKFPTIPSENAPVIYEDKNIRIRSMGCQIGDLVNVDGENFRPSSSERSMFVISLLFENPQTKQIYPVGSRTIFSQYDKIDPDIPGNLGTRPGLRPPELIILVDTNGNDHLPRTRFETEQDIEPKGFLIRRYIWSFPKPNPPQNTVLNLSFTAAILDSLLKRIPNSKVCKTL